MRFLSRAALIISLCSLLFVDISFSKIIKNNLTPKFRRGGISAQNLLKINYFDKNNSFLQKFTPSVQDTVRILALRVSFQPDTLETTTGNGTFILAGNDSTIIDPPPHDREYFLAQLNAVSHYYRSVSNKKLNLTGEVYPLQNESSYELPHKMDYYNPQTTDEELDLRLAELFRDAISAATSQSQVPFSEFDVFVVFHAGVGQDFAENFDTTPNDIPSAFLNKKHLQKHLGNDDPNYPGIQTPDGFIKEGIILPETQNQDGTEFALKGSFVLYLGNQLGLPSLFDTENGRPGIGAWGLMDVGSSNYFGLIPAQPCAWTKVFMGWEEPIVLEPGTNIKIAVSKSQTAPHIYKIPINTSEYFLIENRNRDFNRDQITTGADQFGHRLEFNPYGNFTAQIDTTLGERLGVITKVFDYDFSIPGDGILIWHIDDRIIEENYYTNTINSNPKHRGVDLEEADGSQDIGQNYGFLSPGSGSEFGVADDAFFLGNEIHQIANNVDFISFSPVSSPSSNSYSNGLSGIFLKNFSAIDSIMSFDFFNTLRFENFPQRFSGDLEIKFPPVIASLNNSANKAVFFTPGNNHLFAWNFDGSALIQNNRQLFFDDWRGNQKEFEAAVFDTVNGNFTHFPLLADLTKNGQNEIICSVNQSKIIVWSPILDSNTGFAERTGEIHIPVENMLIWNQNLIVAAGSSLNSIALTSQNIWETGWTVSTNSNILNLCLTEGTGSESFLMVLLETGELQKINQNGQIQNSETVILPEINYSSLISGYLETDSQPSILISSGEQIFAFTQELESLDGFPLQLDEPIKSQPIISDLDQDGFGEIAFATQSELFVLNHNGTFSSGFPLEFSNQFINPVSNTGSPVSLLGTNKSYLFIKDGLNNILTIQNDGELLRNYTFSGGGSTPSPFLSLSDLNEDGLIEVVDANSDGLLNIRQLDFQNRQTDGSWLQTGFDETGNHFNPIKFSTQTPDKNEFLSYAFNYPNPTEGQQTTFRFYLNKDATITIDIFDLTGERIKSIKSSASGNVENEIIWSVGNIESGVYMARLEAFAGQERAYKMIKVAVVK